jgi:hypothetical protein
MKKPMPNYDKLVENENDRTTKEQGETASEMRRRWANSTREGSMENIEGIDHLVAQNEVNLESFDTMDDDNAQSYSRAPLQGETSSKAKKRKTSKDEKDMEQMMVAIQNIASTMREENLSFERSFARFPILDEQVFHLVDDI